jgi:hypothetical protein
LLDDPNGCAQPEHTNAERCGQCVKDDHDVLHFRFGKTRRYFSASAGDLQPMKPRHPSSMGRSLETCSDPRSGSRLGPRSARGHRMTRSPRVVECSMSRSVPAIGSTTAVPSPKHAGPAREGAARRNIRGTSSQCACFGEQTATGSGSSAYTSRTALLTKRSAVQSTDHLVTKRA